MLGLKLCDAVDDSKPVAALDVGGTAIKSGLVHSDGSVSHVRQHRVDADGNAAALLDVLGTQLATLLDVGVDVHAAAIAFPAPFDYPAGVPLLRHKYGALHGCDLSAELRRFVRRPGLPIRFVNDAEAAAVGESTAGAGAGRGRMLIVTLGTGLGTALAADGSLIRHHRGLVVGRIYTRTVETPDGIVAADAVFSAHGLARRLRCPAASLPIVIDDPDHAHTLNDYGVVLGRFLAPIVQQLEADIVVFGGGAGPSTTRFGDSLDATLPTPWQPATLGTSGALLGAARLSELT